ncbi:esterase/lipase family protein [Acinetobacter sp. 197]|uniref:esterase/lipase family protein n=1 Tax=Acinetobacter sp. 197 TaxID=3114696 RepID=UPI003A855BFA
MKKIISYLSFLLLVSLLTGPVQASALQQYKSNFILSSYARTKYPMVFVHGFGLGFNRIGTESIGLDYWYQIPQDLSRHGARVFSAELSAVASNEQLLMQIDEVLALTGHKKVNLIGHSQGGPTIQYIEGVAPHKAASLTAIAGAMQGTPVFVNASQTPLLEPFIHAIGTILGHSMNLVTGNQYPVSTIEALQAMNPEAIQAFNRKYGSVAIPQNCQSQGSKLTPNGIYHYSWMGNRQATNSLDAIESTVVTLGSSFLKGEANDGALPLCSGRYGQSIRQDYAHNHFDEVNQFFGILGPFAQDPVALYRQHANRLKLQGL